MCVIVMQFKSIIINFLHHRLFIIHSIENVYYAYYWIYYVNRDIKDVNKVFVTIIGKLFRIFVNARIWYSRYMQLLSVLKLPLH